MNFERNSYINDFKGGNDMMSNVCNKELAWEMKQLQLLGMEDDDFMQNSKKRNHKKSRSMGYSYETKRFSKYGIQNYINSLDDTGCDNFVV